MENFRSNYKFSQGVLNTFTVDTEKYPLSISYKVKNAKTLRIKTVIIAVLLDALRLKTIYVESFNWHWPKSRLQLSSGNFWIWLKGYQLYIRVRSVPLEISQQAFKTIQVNLKSILPRASLKRTPAGSKTSTITFIATKILNKDSYFHSYKAWKIKSASF